MNPLLGKLHPYPFERWHALATHLRRIGPYWPHIRVRATTVAGSQKQTMNDTCPHLP